MGFSFEAPGVVKTEKSTYRGSGRAASATPIVYRSIDNNIEYKATVIEFK